MEKLNGVRLFTVTFSMTTPSWRTTVATRRTPQSEVSYVIANAITPRQPPSNGEKGVTGWRGKEAVQNRWHHHPSRRLPPPANQLHRAAVAPSNCNASAFVVCDSKSRCTGESTSTSESSSEQAKR
nr:hypothetical protein Iba_chr02aCG10030 [Ipomoea batatas]